MVLILILLQQVNFEIFALLFFLSFLLKKLSKLGALGTFAIGLGAADVVMPLVTGETWLRVPETVKIVYKGEPRFGIGGKGLNFFFTLI